MLSQISTLAYMDENLKDAALINMLLTIYNMQMDHMEKKEYQ